jgi:GT2 family glycosyltransferase
MSQSNSKLLAVVILGWNGKKYLEQFLHSVVSNSQGDGVEVVYADNDSTDDSVTYVSNNFPSVRIIRNKTNSGFAQGYNEALKQIDAKYFLLLNQDVEVTENWLQPLIALMESNPNIAAVQPKLRAFHERDEFEYAGASGGHIDFLGYPFCRGRLFDSVEQDNGQYDDIAPIFWASGAAMMVREDLFDQVGGLDADFFAHQEEIDLCWRLQNAGYELYVVPQSVVYHVGGGSLPQGNPRKTYLNFRNNLFLLLKNLPAFTLVWVLPFRILLDCLAAFYSVIKNKNLIDAKAILKAHFHFIKDFRKMFAKRKLTKPSVPGIVFGGSVIFQYFVKGKNAFSELQKTI